MRSTLVRGGTLEELCRELDCIDTELERLVSGLGPEELRAHPARSGWSIAQCLEHLSITTDAFLPLLSEALAKDPSPQTGQRSFRLGVMGAMLVWLMEPPYRMGTKTPPRFEPGDREADPGVVDGFRARQDQLRNFIRSCEGRNLDRTSVVSPFNAAVRYSVYSALRILAAHQRRHLWQARRVRG